MLTLCLRKFNTRQHINAIVSLSRLQCTRSITTETSPAKEDKGIFNKKDAQSIKGKTGSSTQWLQRKFNDKFTRKAHEDNLISRAAFKLEEIQRKFRIIKRGNIVVDLGAAPGGWSQIASRLAVYKSTKVKELEKDEEERSSRGQVISVDIKDMEPIDGCLCLKLDFTQESAVNTINVMLHGRMTNVVLSDMAPSYSGQKDVDHSRLMDLSTRAFEFAKKVLKPGGHIVLKVSRGGTEGQLKKTVGECFRKVQWYKPEASFKDSSEIYLVGIGYKKDKKTRDITERKYTIVPNNSVDGVEKTLTGSSNVENDEIGKKGDLIKNASPKKESEATEVKLPQKNTLKKITDKKRDKYRIDQIFGLKKLV